MLSLSNYLTTKELDISEKQMFLRKVNLCTNSSIKTTNVQLILHAKPMRRQLKESRGRYTGLPSYRNSFCFSRFKDVTQKKHLNPI